MRSWIFMVLLGGCGAVADGVLQDEPDAASVAKPDAPSPDARVSLSPDAAPQTFGPVVVFSVDAFDPVRPTHRLDLIYATAHASAGSDIVTLHFLDKDTGEPAGVDQLFHWNGGSVGLTIPAEAVRDPAFGTAPVSMTLNYPANVECGSLQVMIGVDPQHESGPSSGRWAFVGEFGAEVSCE